MENILNSIKEKQTKWDQIKQKCEKVKGAQVVVCEDPQRNYTQAELKMMHDAQQKGEKKDIDKSADKTIVQLLKERKIILKKLLKLDTEIWKFADKSLDLEKQDQTSSLPLEQLNTERLKLQQDIKDHKNSHYKGKEDCFENQLTSAQTLINQRVKLVDAISAKCAIFAEMAKNTKIQDGLYAYYKEHISEFIIYYDRELTKTEQWLNQRRSELTSHVTKLEREIKDLFDGREESPNSLIGSYLQREENPTSFDLSAEQAYYNITRENIKLEQTFILTKAAQAIDKGNCLQTMRFLLNALMHDFSKMFPNEEKRKNFEEDVNAISKKFNDREVSILKSILDAAGYERKSTEKTK